MKHKIYEITCEHCGAKQELKHFKDLDTEVEISGGMLCFYCGQIFGWKIVRNLNGELDYEHWR